MIFNENPFDDIKNILDHIDSLAEASSLGKAEIDTDQLWEVITSCRRDIPYEHGEDGASSFKKAAWFMLWFVNISPIVTRFYSGEHSLAKFKSNAVVAFDIGLAALENSVLHTEGEGEKTISNPISISDHAYKDALEALSKPLRPEDQFRAWSLFLEQLVYKTNRHCEYPELSYYPDLMD
ncbi:MAG: hypothetical protein V7717_10590 [Porticoccaceae bacterium]